MIEFTRYDTASGLITGFFVVSNTDDAQSSLWMETDAVIAGLWRSETHFILNGEPTTRPTTGLPENHTIAANTDWILSDIPAGTEVEVDGVILGTTYATELTLSFDAPGVWPVTLRPPFPWIEANCEVTVT